MGVLIALVLQQKYRSPAQSHDPASRRPGTYRPGLLGAGIRTINDKNLIWNDTEGREPELIPPRFETGAKVGTGSTIFSDGDDLRKGNGSGGPRAARPDPAPGPVRRLGAPTSPARGPATFEGCTRPATGRRENRYRPRFGQQGVTPGGYRCQQVQGASARGTRRSLHAPARRPGRLQASAAHSSGRASVPRSRKAMSCIYGQAGNGKSFAVNACLREHAPALTRRIQCRALSRPPGWPVGAVPSAARALERSAFEPSCAHAGRRAA